MYDIEINKNNLKIIIKNTGKKLDEEIKEINKINDRKENDLKIYNILIGNNDDEDNVDNEENENNENNQEENENNRINQNNEKNSEKNNPEWYNIKGISEESIEKVENYF